MKEYNEFLSRINRFTKKEFYIDRNFFYPNQLLEAKVNKNNCFREFYGDTTTFDLEQKDKDKIDKVILKLYSNVPECFSEKLDKSHLHMTLHDLSSNVNRKTIEKTLENNANKIREILKNEEIISSAIKLKTYCITNILNISLVLVLLPIDENEYKKLMCIYNLINRVQVLNYKFLPHITLGYYNINGFDIPSIIKLEKLVNELNQHEFEINVNTKYLFYQHFTSMNNYKKILRLCNNGGEFNNIS